MNITIVYGYILSVNNAFNIVIIGFSKCSPN